MYNNYPIFSLKSPGQLVRYMKYYNTHSYIFKLNVDENMGGLLVEGGPLDERTQYTEFKNVIQSEHLHAL